MPRGGVASENSKQRSDWFANRRPRGHLTRLTLPHHPQLFYPSWTNRGKGLVLLNLLVLLCASNWVVVKQAQQALPSPAAFTAARFAVAAAAFAPFLARASRPTLTAGLELGVWSAAGYAAQAAGLLTCDASRASFLSAFTVVVVPLLNGLTGARVPLLTWLCAGAAVVGVYLLEGGGGSGTAAGAFPLKPGDVWSLASAVAFAIQIWRTEARARQAGPDQTLPLLAVTVATVAALSTIAAAAADPAGAAAVTASPAAALAAARSLDWAPVLWTGLASTDGVLLIELVALRWVSSTDAAITYTLEPVLGAICAWLVLGERFGATSFCGAALILCAAFFSSMNDDADDAKKQA